MHCGKEIKRVWCPGGWSPWLHVAAVRVSIFCRLDQHKNYHPGAAREAEPQCFDVNAGILASFTTLELTDALAQRQASSKSRRPWIRPITEK